MARKANRLTLSNVRSVFRLLYEVRDLGVSPIAWRRHMVAGLLRLAGASTGVAAEAVVPDTPGTPRLLGTVIGGVKDRRLVAVYRALVERGGYACDLRREGLADPTNTALIRTRPQMAESRAWLHRPDLDPWRTLNCEHFICSNQYLPSARCVHLVILTRSGREQPFNELDRRVVALFHAELGRLWRQGCEEAGVPLSPALQQTLELLLDGLSEPQIVVRLGLSPHTIHDHVKRLYRRFDVNSRGQLLARLSRTPLSRAPRLCVNLLEGDDDQRFDGAAMVEDAGGLEVLPGESQAPRSRVINA
ncbi:MAG: helix-turn-helix transcriptional regulator [Phycisphaerae bacterium]